jgi:hypothetical protein
VSDVEALQQWPWQEGQHYMWTEFLIMLLEYRAAIFMVKAKGCHSLVAPDKRFVEGIALETQSYPRVKIKDL